MADLPVMVGLPSTATGAGRGASSTMRLANRKRKGRVNHRRGIGTLLAPVHWAVVQVFDCTLGRPCHSTCQKAAAAGRAALDTGIPGHNRWHPAGTRGQPVLRSRRSSSLWLCELDSRHPLHCSIPGQGTCPSFVRAESPRFGRSCHADRCTSTSQGRDRCGTTHEQSAGWSSVVFEPSRRGQEVS
jgi:hypothetical protein